MAKKKNRSKAQRQPQQGAEKIDRDDRMELEGEVTHALPSTLFKVRLANGLEVLATLSGKMRQNRIRILPGDWVTIEVSPYDTSRGRITWRKKE